MKCLLKANYSKYSEISAHGCFDLCLIASQVLEFDLKGSALDSSSYIDVIVKDYETIGKDK